MKTSMSPRWALGAMLGVIAFSGGVSVMAQGADNSAAVAASGVSSTQLKAGSGSAIVAGQIAVVEYTGWLFDAAAADHKGRQFDSSRTHGQPFQFRLGAGQVIRGWDQGIVGMKTGEQRVLIIPADLGYGANGAGGGIIPPNATLVFEVELVEIR